MRIMCLVVCLSRTGRGKYRWIVSRRPLRAEFLALSPVQSPNDTIVQNPDRFLLGKAYRGRDQSAKLVAPHVREQGFLFRRRFCRQRDIPERELLQGSASIVNGAASAKLLQCKLRLIPPVDHKLRLAGLGRLCNHRLTRIGPYNRGEAYP